MYGCNNSPANADKSYFQIKRASNSSSVLILLLEDQMLTQLCLKLLHRLNFKVEYALPILAIDPTAHSAEYPIMLQINMPVAMLKICAAVK